MSTRVHSDAARALESPFCHTVIDYVCVRDSDKMPPNQLQDQEGGKSLKRFQIFHGFSESCHLLTLREMRPFALPLLVLVVPALAACGSKTAAPNDNAVATAYGPTAYPWAAGVLWNCTFNIADYPGSSADVRFVRFWMRV